MIQPGAIEFTRILSASEIARETAGQPHDRRFRRGIAGHAALADHPAGGAEIDDRAAAGVLHHRRDRLHGEELMAQIDRHALVPVVGGDALDRMALVMGSVVDQDRDRSVGVGRFASIGVSLRASMSRRSQGRNSRRRVTVRLDLRLTSASLGSLRDVDEGDLGALGREPADDRGTDAGAAAGDEDRSFLPDSDRWRLTPRPPYRLCDAAGTFGSEGSVKSIALDRC